MHFTVLKLPMPRQTIGRLAVGHVHWLGSQVGGGFSLPRRRNALLFLFLQTGPGAPISLWARQIGLRAFKAPAARSLPAESNDQDSLELLSQANTKTLKSSGSWDTSNPS
jgi:hypothetical protein